MKETIIKCDVCEKKNTKEISLYVIFETEQDEGRKHKPYIETCTLDICTICKARLLDGHVIFASGAQGYNHYYFKDKKLDNTVEII